MKIIKHILFICFFFFLFIVKAQILLPEVGITSPVRGVLTDQMCSGTTVLKETFDGTPGFVPVCQGWSATAITNANAAGSAGTWNAWYGTTGTPYPKTYTVTANICNTSNSWYNYAMSNGLIAFTQDPVLASVESRIQNHTFMGTPAQPPACTSNTPGTGSYSITNENCDNNGYWYVFNDHTNPPKGNFIIFDANATANYFYSYTVPNVCSGTSLSFSVWLSSAIKIEQNNGAGPAWPNKANITIELYDPSNNIIARFNTGNLKDGYEDLPAYAGKWKQYGFVFVVPTGINSITMKIHDNGSGSAGNDFVMDDIEIRICNPPITITSNPVLCKPTVPITATFNNNNNITGGTIEYRWEYSTDNINWNILGADSTKAIGAIATFTSTVIEPSINASIRYYRMVAGSPGTYTTNCKIISASNKPNVNTSTCGPQISITSDTICNGETSKLRATVLSGKKPYTFAWSANFTPAQISSINDSISEITISPTITTSYTITVTDATNTNPAQVQGSVTVITPPTLADVCNNASAYTLPNAIPANCTISGTGVTGTTFDPSIASIGLNTINYTLNDKSCPTTIKVNNCGIIFTVTSDTICKGESGPLTLTVNITKGNQPYKYVWSDDPANIITTSNTTFTHTILNAPVSTTTYTVTITENLGASDFRQSVITVIEPPTLPDVCMDKPAFTLPEGVPANCSISGTGATGNIFNPQTAGAGTTIINYSLGNKSCPTNQKVNRLPVVDAGANIQLCINGGDTSLLATSTDVVTYKWNNNLTTAGITINPMQTTTYTLTATDNNTGCSNKDSVVVTVNDSLLPVINGKTSICKGDTTTLNVNGGITYSWSTSKTTNQIIVTPTITTTFSVTVTNGATCKGSNKTVVTVNPIPIVNFSPNVTSGCQPLNVTFTDKTIPVGSNYLWNFGDISSGIDNTSANPSPTHIYKQQGIYDVSSKVTTATGCQHDTSFPQLISVKPKPLASFSYSPVNPTNFNPTVNFIDLSIGSNLTWLWNFDDIASANSNSSSQQNPTHDFVGAGIHNVQLTAISGNGCTDDTIVPVNVQAEFTFYAPNAFTPNDDGINDYFLPKGLGILANSYHLYIYSRWGEKIFESDDMNKPWDGKTTDSNVLCPEGVYTWLVIFNDLVGKKYQYSGIVTLLK